MSPPRTLIPAPLTMTIPTTHIANPSPRRSSGIDRSSMHLPSPPFEGAPHLTPFAPSASNGFCFIIVGIDSYSDVTVAHPDIVYDIHPIVETVHTGAGEATYTEESRVDIADGLY